MWNSEKLIKLASRGNNSASGGGQQRNANNGNNGRAAAAGGAGGGGGGGAGPGAVGGNNNHHNNNEGGAAGGEGAEWNLQDIDRFSFDDSDRFEEDSLCSWTSEPESLCNNWRGWKKQIPNTTSTNVCGASAGAAVVSALSSAIARRNPIEGNLSTFFLYFCKENDFCVTQFESVF